MTLPGEIVTARLRLCRWTPLYAPALQEALEESVDHLRGWIPRAVAESAPVEQLEARLRGYATSFDEDREWLYAVVDAGDGRLLGGVGLHARTTLARVAAADADRVEIGYWLRRTAVGRGYVTEAAAALLAHAAALPGRGHVELRCDPRNRGSIAVAQRLGFTAVGTVPHPSGDPDAPDLMVWERRPSVRPARP
jgi:RimJ/RimL family protein N-acetyltransferase